jgi:predicted nucleic acid-binding protein
MTTEQPTLAVLDTNIVLDLFLFQDPHTDSLRKALTQGHIHWIATQHMRNELERVLTYSHIVAKLEFYNKSSSDILQQFDQLAQITGQPLSKAPYVCKDTDDQVFIDLAHTLAQLDPGQQIHLISKDKAVLSMQKRLAKLSIHVRSMPEI